MDKYYVPTIGEFHIGFEYEYKGKHMTGYTTNTLSEEDYYYMDENGYMEDSNPLNNYSKFRVKYLDLDDIKEAGWKQREWEPNQFTINNDDYELNFDTLVDNPELGIGITIYDIMPSMIFNGYIKNKSELIKIMKQLDIKKDE